MRELRIRAWKGEEDWDEKAIVVFTVLAALTAFTAPALVSGFFWDVDSKTKGCICCIKGTPMIAKNDADCAKVGGKVVKALKDCGKKEK